MLVFLYKRIGTLLTCSLLFLLLGCSEQNVFLEKSDKDFVSTPEDINEKIKKENDRLIKDKPDEADTENENSSKTENTVEMI